jgi:hypothetical protein
MSSDQSGRVVFLMWDCRLTIFVIVTVVHDARFGVLSTRTAVNYGAFPFVVEYKYVWPVAKVYMDIEVCVVKYVQSDNRERASELT